MDTYEIFYQRKNTQQKEGKREVLGKIICNYIKKSLG